MEKWYEEFLYRGRPSTSSQPSGWHVVIGAIGDETMNKPVLSDPMTPEQAEAAGFPLSVILEGINSKALIERDAAHTDRDEKVAAAETDRDQKVAAAEADRDERVSAAQADRDEKVAAAVSAQTAAEAARDQALAEKMAAEAALAAKQPPATSISRAAFLARFTRDELLAVSAAARSSDLVSVWLMTAQAQDQIDLADPLTRGGLADIAVDVPVLTPERQSAILALP